MSDFGYGHYLPNALAMPAADARLDASVEAASQMAAAARRLKIRNPTPKIRYKESEVNFDPNHDSFTRKRNDHARRDVHTDVAAGSRSGATAESGIDYCAPR